MRIDCNSNDVATRVFDAIVACLPLKTTTPDINR